MAFKQRTGNQKTQMTKPGMTQQPQGKQMPDNYNRGADHSTKVSSGNRAGSWGSFKKWPCKGPGNSGGVDY